MIALIGRGCTVTIRHCRGTVIVTALISCLHVLSIVLTTLLYLNLDMVNRVPGIGLYCTSVGYQLNLMTHD